MKKEMRDNLKLMSFVVMMTLAITGLFIVFLSSPVLRTSEDTQGFREWRASVIRSTSSPSPTEK